MKKLIATAITLAIISGCSFASSPTQHWIDKGSNNLQWPPPPGPPKIIYLREVKGSTELQKNSTSQKIFSWLTGDREEKLPFIAPYGVAADGMGHIWVTDMGIHGVHQIDLVKNKFSYIFNADGNPLVTPAGVAVDLERKRLYVSDTTLAKVFLYDLNGRFISSLDAPDSFGRPAGLSLDKNGQLYVVDAQKNRLYIFSPAGDLLRIISSNILPEQTFNAPSNVAINDQGQFFVVDSLNFRIESFSAEGKSLGTFGSAGDAPGYFARPRGIALDNEGHIYVTDASFDNIQVFDKSGKLLIYFGKSGKNPGEFSLPAGMAFDRYNRLYVVDSYNQRLQIFEYLP